MKKNVFIIGLGRFGQSLAINLQKQDVSVTVADIDEKIVKEISSSYNFNGSLVINSSNIDVLRSAAITKFDYIVVAMSSVEDSIMTCANLKELEIIKKVTAKAQNITHKRVLTSLGVPNVILPESYAAEQVAQKILNDDMEIIKQGSENTISKITITNNTLIGKKFKELINDEFRIFAVTRNEPGAKSIFKIDDLEIKKLDKVLVIAPTSNLKLVRKLFIA